MSAGTLKGNVELDLTGLRATGATAVQIATSTGQAMEKALHVTASVNADSAVYELAELDNAVAKVATAVSATSRVPLTLRTADAVEKLDTLDRRVEVFARDLRRIGQTPVRVDVRQPSEAFGVLGDAVQRVLSPLGLMPGHMGAVASRGASLASTLSSVASGFGTAGGAFGGVSEALATLGPLLTAAAPAIAAVGTAAAIAAPFVAGFGLSIVALNSTPVQLAAKMEQTKIAFNTLTGSVQLAETTLRSLRSFADTTPFEFPEIASAAKQLLGMGIGANEVTATLRRLGDISSGLGQPLGEMAYLFGQIRSQGRAMTQDLNQFAGRGVPIYGELAKVLHTNEAGVRAFAEAGKIGFAEIEAAIVSMTSAGGKFSGLTEAQSQSLLGLQSTAADAFGAMETQIGDVLIKNLGLKDSIRSVSDLIVAATPAVVGLFDVGSKAAAPFADLTRSLVDLIKEMSAEASAAGKLMQNAFGVDGVDALVAVMGLINPLTSALKLMKGVLDATAAVVRGIREAIEDVNLLLGDTAEKNSKPITKDEVAAAVAKRGGTPQTSTAAVAAAGPNAPADQGRASGSRSSGTSDADKAAQSMAKAAAAAAKAQDEQSKALHESWERADAANARAHVESLRAAGRDVEARMLEISERFKRSIADAKTPFERQALERQRDVELSAAQADGAEKQAKFKVAAEKEAAETAKRTAKYQLDAQVALLEAQGRGQEAQLLKFDAEWKSRIEAITNAGERAAAQDAYAAERQKKVADAAGHADVAPSGSALSRLPQSLGDAQQRVKAAKAGSGERELARLDLRDVLGTLSPDESARRDRLGERFGRGLGAGDVSAMPSVRSPLAAVGPALQPPVAGGRAVGTPAMNVNPTLNVNEDKVAQACVRAMEPMVDRKLQRLAARLSDRNYANATGSGY